MQIPATHNSELPAFSLHFESPQPQRKRIPGILPAYKGNAISTPAELRFGFAAAMWPFMRRKTTLEDSIWVGLACHVIPGGITARQTQGPKLHEICLLALVGTYMGPPHHPPGRFFGTRETICINFGSNFIDFGSKK